MGDGKKDTPAASLPIRFEQAIEIDPKNAKPYASYGTVLNKLERFEEASAMFEQAIEADPKDAWIYFDWSHALQQQGRTDEAIAKLRRAAEIDYTLTEFVNNEISSLLSAQK